MKSASACASRIGRIAAKNIEQSHDLRSSSELAQSDSHASDTPLRYLKTKFFHCISAPISQKSYRVEIYTMLILTTRNLRQNTRGPGVRCGGNAHSRSGVPRLHTGLLRARGPAMQGG